MILASLLFIVIHFSEKNATRLDLSITGFSIPTGMVRMAIFNSEATFLDEKNYLQLLEKPVVNGQNQLDFHLDLPSGEYAISVFHDENSNGRLDKNWLGIPTEAYGFSQNFRAKWGAPTWAKTTFQLFENGSSMSIRLEKW